jgi:hypothetical protein
LTSIVHVEFAAGMELALNLGWALLALCMFCVWSRFAPAGAKERRAQFVALAVVILILLPAISMTDDLVAAQNPAEVDCCVRRDHDCFHAHTFIPTASAGPVPEFQGLPVRLVQMMPSMQVVSPYVEIPALAPIQNRPPPAA